MEEKTRVILVTDGDHVAQKTVEATAKQLGLRCISLSGGNPTSFTGSELVALIKQAKYDPVLVMVDDNGVAGTGRGEHALEYIVHHPDIEVLGALAVASNTPHVHGVHVDCSVDRDCHIVQGGVNKDGSNDREGKGIIKGDTVDILETLNIPIIIGIGDIGKMDGRDDLKKGCPVTARAVQEILQRSGIEYGHQ